MSNHEKLHPALLFYLQHWDDMNALCYDNNIESQISPERWAKFSRVVEDADREALDVLRTASALLETGKRVTYDRVSQETWIKENWAIQGRLGVRPHRGARGRPPRKIARISTFFTRTLTPEPQPVLAMAFWYHRDGNHRGHAYLEATKGLFDNSPAFASRSLEGTGPWAIVIGQWPITEGLRRDELLDGVQRTVKAFERSAKHLRAAAHGPQF